MLRKPEMFSVKKKGRLSKRMCMCVCVMACVWQMAACLCTHACRHQNVHGGQVKSQE